MKKFSLLVVSLCAISMLAGCSETSSSGAGDENSVDLTAETLRFVGSTSVESMSNDLSDAWVDTFSANNKPKAEHNHTGSGDAFKKLENGTGDIGFASREFTKSEQTADYSYGKICADGIAVIVNTKNANVNQITLQELRDIYVNPDSIANETISMENFGADYSSEKPITNWNQLGGSDAEINPYTRDTSSGTRDGFCTKIGIEDAKTNDELLSTEVSGATSNGDMVSKVESDANGIGYCSLEGLDEHPNVKTLKVSSDGKTYVEASEANIKDGSYPLQRNFNMMYPKAASDDRDEIKIALIESFIAYVNSSDGDLIVKAAGGVLTQTHSQSYEDILQGADWAVTLGLRK